MAEKLFLIDGSNHAFRVFFALPRMTAGGFNTGALLGFANMLQKLENDYAPDDIVVVFDKGKSFRVHLYPDYKGHRPSMPEELREQWPHFSGLVEAWGYRSLVMEGYEADDIIGTLAYRFAGSDREVTIVTGDKDMQQLVQPNIRILDLMKDLWIDKEQVIEKFGVPPERVIDVMALAGDSSDNIPGVEGIGIKTATALIQTHGTLEDLLANADQIKGKRGENLREQKDMALLSKQLVTIVTDMDFDLTLEDLRAHTRDAAKLKELFVQWQFRTHLKNLELGADAAPSDIDRSHYRTIRTEADLQTAITAIRQAGHMAFDLETTSLDTLAADLVGVGLCWSNEDAVYIPLNHVVDGRRAPDQLTVETAREHLEPLLSDPTVTKTGQNLKYDQAVLINQGWAVAGITGDTMLADYLLEPERNRHGLDDLSLRYLGHSPITYADVTGDPDTVSFAQVPIDKATEYGAEDAHLAWLLDQKLTPALADRGLSAIYNDIEVPVARILAQMELHGIGINVEGLRSLSVELAERIAQSEQTIYGLAGREFTINSPKQLSVILFEERGLTPIKKTKTGFSTNADTLEQLAAVDPLPAEILQYRTLAKLKNTYVDTLPDTVSAISGRIHTSFHQAVTATGRLSSNSPNLQNIPIRSEDGRRIRDCFVPDPGHVFLSCDYSQVELRILAHYCGDGALVDAFRTGQDIHSRTASEVFGAPLDAVTSDERSAAKAINFGIVYGMSAFRLANDLRITRKEATAYLENYFARYPQVKRVQESLIAAAREKGHSETLWGRRRPIVDINASNGRDRAAAERIALNSPIQGSAADLIKLAMIAVDEVLAEAFPKVRILLQVHDELLIEVPDEQADDVASLVKSAMEGAAELIVPLVVDTGLGNTWARAH
jgi:DNA polymerase-1